MVAEGYGVRVGWVILIGAYVVVKVERDNVSRRVGKVS